MSIKWTRKVLTNPNDLMETMLLINNHKPKISAFDTETTGLHIIKDTPFLFIIGYLVPNKNTGYVFLVDIRKDEEFFHNTVRFFKETLKETKVLAHNIKYDLHMMHNIGYPELFSNVSDTSIYMRLGLDDPVSLALKWFARTYISKDANLEEKEVSLYKKYIRQQQTKTLLERLSEVELPDEIKLTGRETRWTKGIVDRLLSDIESGELIIFEEVEKIVNEVLADNSLDPNYYPNIPDDILYPYAFKDVELTLEAFVILDPIVKSRGQLRTLELEEKIILPLYEMERVGFAFNKEYMLESKKRVYNEIMKYRTKLYDLLGERVTAGQHKRLKEILNEWSEETIESVDKKNLEKLSRTTEQKEIKEVTQVIIKLRTLEKWYSTYILNWLNKEYNGRVYTQIKQAGTVTGRVSSDFQQFPQKTLKDSEGNELFSPRKMVKVTGGDYPAIFYIDFNQIELRFQAIYTILIGNPDINLCRAYMPFLSHDKDGNQYEPTNVEHQKRIHTEDWFLNENNEKWVPVHLHRLMTYMAFHVNEEDNHPDWKTLYRQGKSTNFASNYGGGIRGIMSAAECDEETAKVLLNAYNKAFSSLIHYKRYVSNFINTKGYAEGLFGRRYYNTGAHQAQNYLVQGSAADFLKDKIYKVSQYIKEKGYKSRFQMNIHDEMSFELHKDDPISIITEIRDIMGELTNTPVPITAEPDITYTTWDEKETL